MNLHKHVFSSKDTFGFDSWHIYCTSPYAEAELRAVEVHHIVAQKPVQDIDHHWLKHHLYALFTQPSACFPSSAIPGPLENVVVFTECPVSWNKHHWMDWEVLRTLHCSACATLPSAAEHPSRHWRRWQPTRNVHLDHVRLVSQSVMTCWVSHSQSPLKKRI